MATQKDSRRKQDKQEQPEADEVLEPRGEANVEPEDEPAPAPEGKRIHRRRKAPLVPEAPEDQER